MIDEKNLNNVASQCFNKIRGRFPNVTCGDQDGNITNKPDEARYFDFEYSAKGSAIGKISCSIEPDSIVLIYNDNLVGDQDDSIREDWYSFLKGMRKFARARMLGFDVRNISKDSNSKRDYKFLAANRQVESINLKNYIENL